MATQEKTWNVANRLHSLKDSDNPEVNHIIAGADEIYDDAKGAKQSDINAQTDAAIADRYTKAQVDAAIDAIDVSEQLADYAKKTEVSTAVSAETARAQGVEATKANASEVATALAAKQDVLTFDNTPTDGSTNPVTSGGVKAAIDAVDVSEQLEDVAFLGEDDGQAVIPEFDPQTDTLLKTTQSLTNTEKETVIGNILDKNYIAGSYVGKGKKYLKLNVGAPVATDFDGFVDGTTTEQSSLAEVPDNIYFDRTNNRFIASKGEGLLMKYYMSWQNGDAYMNPNRGAYFKNEDNYYQWNGTTLEATTVGNVNKLTQADFDAENTTYVIRYDFDLCGQSITIPEGCVLEFDGGSLSNGTLVGNDTSISASIVKIFGNNITISGSWNINGIYPEWFGAKGDGITDSTSAIQKAIDIATSYSSNKKVIFSRGTYIISSTLNIPSSIALEGSGGKQNIENTVIRAGAQMENMIITSTNINLIVSNLSFYGGRVGTYYQDGDFNYDATSLAKNCFNSSASYGYTYSNFTNCYFTGFDGYAIIKLSYGSYVNKCQVKRCGYGISLSTSNNVSITETEFSLIGYVAIMASNYAIIRNCIFDITGQPAIYIQALHGAIIEGCYFENISKYGVYVTANDINLNESKIKCCIFCTGISNTIRNGNESWKCHRLYPVENVTISNNDVDWLTETTDKYFVFAASLNQSKIVQNYFRTDKFDAVFGIPGVNDAYSNVSDVEISQNNYNRTLLKKIKFVNSGDSLTFSVGATNITSTDSPSKDNFDKNLVNYFHVFGYNYDGASDTFVEQEDNYIEPSSNKKFRVFKNETNATERFAITNRKNDVEKIKNGELNGYIIGIKYFVSTDGIQWNTRRMYVYKSDSLEAALYIYFIEVPSNTYITVPEIQVLGEPYSYQEYSPMCISTQGALPPGMQFVAGTKIRVSGGVEKYVRYKIANGQGGGIIVPNIINVDKANIESFFTVSYNGIKIFDTSSNKLLTRINNTWVDETGIIAGTPTSGTFANKPTVANNNIPVGFKYFCTDKQTTEGTTDGIEIIHKGNDVWVDALGRTIS